MMLSPEEKAAAAGKGPFGPMANPDARTLAAPALALRETAADDVVPLWKRHWGAAQIETRHCRNAPDAAF